MRPRFALPAFAAAAMLSCLLVLALTRPARVANAPAHEHDPAHRNMSRAAMEAWSKSWWDSHPRVGSNSGQPPSATFTVADFQFDLDGNTATLVDTAKILMGQSVRWQWVNGFHSATNGASSLDPGAGMLFDQAIDNSNLQFNFVFNTAGTFPFFCRPHEFANMSGIVIVSANTGVGGPFDRVLGFTSAPAPNPARRDVSFGFAMVRSGRARAEVFDTGGRRVAVVLDRDLDAGPHVATWNGRARDGAYASPGIYMIRLQLPGYSSSRSVVIAR